MDQFQGSAASRRLFFLALCLAASLAGADERDVDEIVVSATRLETSLRDVARSLTVIDKQRIQNATQQLGIDEALASVPGLYMQNRYNFSQDLRISLRGFGARSSFGIRGVKVIVDGIPETLPDGQAQVDSIDLGSAERIEVLRGPASAQYGNASGGVIAVVSEAGGEEPFVEAGLSAGELGYNKFQFKTGGSHRALDYMLNLSRQEFDGYREHSSAEGSLVNGKLRYRLNDSDRLSLAFNHADQPTARDAGGIDAAQAAAEPRSARDLNLQFDAGEALDQQRLGIVYDRERAAGTLSVRNYYVWRDFENLLPFTDGGAVSFSRFFYGAGLQYTLGDVVPERLQLTFGADIERQDDDRLRFDNNDGTAGARVFDQQERVDGNAAFALGQYRVNDRWLLSAGLRYDRVRFDVTDRYLSDGNDSGSIDFDHVSPALGVNYSLGEHTVFASYSNSFETPTTTELANPDASGGFNPDLEPQEADNYELGFRSGGDALSFEVTAFRIDLENELVPFELDGFPGRTFFSNAGSSKRRGLETAVAWSGDSGFGVDASWTWSDFTFERFTDANGNDFSGRRLPGLPERFGYLGLSWESPRGVYALFETIYSGNLHATNANDVTVDAYAVSNLRLSHAFDRGRWRIRPHVGVNNVFNERYNGNIRVNAFGGRYYEPAPPRNLYAGVVVNFRPGPL
jgi:iron complex outermembrane receptor protein